MHAGRYVHRAAGVAVAASFLLWIATGREGFTRWPNAKLESSDAAPAAGEEELLADIGFSDGGAMRPAHDIRSRFAFGLLPGGFDLRHLPSVATVVFMAGALSISSVLLVRCGCRRACRPSHT